MAKPPVYRSEDIDKIGIVENYAILFMVDESVFIVTLPAVDVAIYISAEELYAGHKLGEWLTLIYFFIADKADRTPCPDDCACRSSDPDSLSDHDVIRIFT